MTIPYAELQVTSNFSFLRGASHPEELAETAAALGHAALAITDRNSLAGVVRAHVAAKRACIRLVVGARLDPTDGMSLLIFPTCRAAYGRLARLLTLGKRRAEKGLCLLSRADIAGHAEGQLVVALPPDDPRDEFINELNELKENFKGACYLAGQHLYRGDDARRLARLAEIAARAETPLVASNDVHAHNPDRRPLQDVLTCIREHRTVHAAGYRLHANAERYLKPANEMARLFADYPGAIARTVEIAERCAFSLDELRYEYPVDPVPEGRTPQQELERQSWQGARERYPGGVPEKVKAALEHELRLIDELAYAPYFLTVHDIVRFARGRGILCQGRGSAANSAVCYCLGITAVDPGRIDLLFERFVSAERGEPPDIDVDFEHERREEVIQYIYEKYGRERAGLTATVVSYRARSAIREVGKALGLSLDAVDALAGMVWGRSSRTIPDDDVRDAGLDPDDPTLRRVLELTDELIGFPRHLSQHVGGFVITKGPLSEVVPIENAAMEDRTVIEWDKDDLDALGILKIDVLSLGMLTCIRKGFDLLAAHYGRRVTLATLPAEDRAVYDMLCLADSVGVFQVESRAQMSMLPRLKPRDFYDLVIEVAIVRPGPIQGDMVHPYLRRRNGEEKVVYPSDELRQVLEKTLGVPLFQEQAMKISIVAAGFTPAEADALRRAMATFRKTGAIHGFREKMIEGMAARGYERDFAERCFNQIEGFGEYGFPESHAASFALLVYVSAWLKCHYPAVFACALLNSQPMGFYAPAQIVRDARDHGIEVRPVDINFSAWDCTMEPAVAGTNHPKPTAGNGLHRPLTPTLSPPRGEREGPAQREGEGGRDERPRGDTSYALRLGFRQIKGFREDDAVELVSRRGNGYPDMRTLWRGSGLPAGALERLARADAFGSIDLGRRDALWAVKALAPAPLPLFAAQSEEDAPAEDPVRLPAMTAGEEVVDDYASLRLSLKSHPLTLLRDDLAEVDAVPAGRLTGIEDGRRLTVAGLVLVRQRPGSAKGIIFMTLEDETGVANVIVWPPVFERFRRVILGARLLAVRGRLQREGIVIHIIAEHIADFSGRLARLGDGAPRPAPDGSFPGTEPEATRASYPSRDFH